MTERSQQQAVGVPPALLPCVSIQISEPVADKLHQICAKHEVQMKELVSQLLTQMFLFHKREIQEIVAQIKRNQKCHDY